MSGSNSILPGFGCPVGFSDQQRIGIGHGGGGVLTRELFVKVFLPAFGNPVLERLGDAALLPPVEAGGRLAFSTDAYVVQPLFFPGGSIGDLAVNGTVNDLAMEGARAIALSAAFILEEGLSIDLLTELAQAMGRAARDAGVEIVTGDTKVVERGRGDGCSITTAGIGVVPERSRLGATPIGPGDLILVSGSVGNHGMAVMSVREGLAFESPIVSDTQPLHRLVSDLLTACPETRLLRDPTRGGLAATLGEIAVGAGFGIELEEAAVPIEPAVAAACAILGLDPLEVASEGRFVAVVAAGDAQRGLAALRGHQVAGGYPAALAAQIGRVVAEHPGMVVARTAIGARRIVPMPLGELLPRIC